MTFDSFPGGRRGAVGVALALAAAAVGVSMAVTDGGSKGTARAHTVSAPRTTLTSTRLDLVTGTDSVIVTSADLGNKLFQATTPAGARQIPQATSNGGVVTLSLTDVPGPGPAQVDIVLNARISWSVSFDGGASAERVDLSGAHLSALTFAAGSSSISAVLPAPSGEVPVLMQGGASSFVVQTPAGVPYQVSFGGGAGSATIEGVVHSGVAGGTVVASPNWATAANRYRIDNAAGVSAFTLAAGHAG